MDTTSYRSPDITADRVVECLAGAGLAIDRPRATTRTRLDTFDGRLHAAGLRLELRRSGPTELILHEPGAPATRVVVEAVPRGAADLPDGPIRARLAPLLDVRVLLPVLTVATRARTARRIDRAGTERVRVTVYERLVVKGAALPAPAWIAELERRADFPKDAARAAKLLGQLRLERRKGDALDEVAAALGTDLAGVRCSPTVPLVAGGRASEAFRRVLANLAFAVDANWKGTVDHVDPEFLHDLRVAVRRTRSVLAQGRGVLPDPVRATYREGFGWLGTATGPARDFDVYMIEWGSYLAPLAPGAASALAPVHDHLAERRSEEHARLAKVLRSARYRSLMAGWHGWLDGPPPGRTAIGRDGSRRIGPVAADRIGRAQRQLLARGRGIGPDTAAEELHELRKDAKKLRYLLECLGGLYDPGPRTAFVKRLKSLQDNLGEHQDTEVHAAELRAVALALHGSVGPDTLAAMEQLTGHLEARRLAARATFARRFATYDTTATAAGLQDLLASKARPPASARPR